MYSPITVSSTINKNDVIPFQLQKPEISELNAVVKYATDTLKKQVLEVYPGPEFEKLSKELKEKLLQKKFSVSKNNSRMAYQLEERVHNDLQSILTQPVLPGTVQFTPSGNLIVLMRDCQTTGGYPRVFQLTEQSINLLAQKKQGDTIQFQLKNNEKTS
jgi:allophanate hydrolase subunit 2